MTDTITETRSRLLRFRGRYPEIATRFGFSYSTLSKFANGERGVRPSFKFIGALTGALRELEREGDNAPQAGEAGHG